MENSWQSHDHPNQLFDYIADTFNHIIELKNEHHEQIYEELVQALHTELQEYKARLVDKENQIDDPDGGT